jgi:hypothetical protein
LKRISNFFPSFSLVFCQKKTTAGSRSGPIKLRGSDAVLSRAARLHYVQRPCSLSLFCQIELCCVSLSTRLSTVRAKREGQPRGGKDQSLTEELLKTEYLVHLHEHGEEILPLKPCAYAAAFCCACRVVYSICLLSKSCRLIPRSEGQWDNETRCFPSFNAAAFLQKDIGHGTNEYDGPYVSSRIAPYMHVPGFIQTEYCLAASLMTGRLPEVAQYLPSDQFILPRPSSIRLQTRLCSVSSLISLILPRLSPYSITKRSF